MGSMVDGRPHSRVLSQLRGAGLRTTRQRLALGKLLFETGDRHVTAEMLHSEALRASIRVSLATVYNTLHQFTAAGLLREIVVDPGRSYFDTNVSEHHHFYFEAAARLEDIRADDIRVAGMPDPPRGTEVERVDVVVRLREAGS